METVQIIKTVIYNTDWLLKMFVISLSFILDNIMKSHLF